MQARNVWGAVYVNELVLRDQSSLHNGTLDQRLYVQQDANWDVTAVVSTTGVVLEHYAYDPYGAVSVLTSGWSGLGSSAYAMPYLWQGERYDWLTGLYRTDRRDVSPSLMRPMQADPLGLGPDRNDYRWEGDGPIASTDPTGLHPPSHPKCVALLARIYALQTDIQKREAEYIRDVLQLPETCPGDRKQPSLSRSGHRRIIGEEKKKLAELISRYKAQCNDPDTRTPVVPVPPVVATDTSEDLEKLKLALSDCPIRGGQDA